MFSSVKYVFFSNTISHRYKVLDKQNEYEDIQEKITASRRCIHRNIRNAGIEYRVKYIVIDIVQILEQNHQSEAHSQIT